jgi:toxin ParE1/3/4
MPRYVLSPQARDDLLELRDYIAQDNPAAARRVLNELREAMRRLAQMPELGHV